MFHFYQIPFTDNPERLGYQKPPHGVSMTPNIPKPRSRGRLYLTSADPAVKPALDFRYFTDEDDYDGRTLVDGIKLAREVAKSEPLAKLAQAGGLPRAPRSPPTRRSASTRARSRTPSTTRRAPAGWAPPTTRSPSSTRS